MAAGVKVTSKVALEPPVIVLLLMAPTVTSALFVPSLVMLLTVSGRVPRFLTVKVLAVPIEIGIVP